MNMTDQKHRKRIPVWMLTLLVGICIAAASGCSKTDDASLQLPPQEQIAEQPREQAEPPATPPTPATLQVYITVPFAQEQYVSLIEQPIKHKFPHLTLVKTDRGSDTIENRVAAGNLPDLIITGFYDVGIWSQMEVPYTLDDMVRRYQLDTSRFEPVAIEALRNFRPGNLIALPLYMNKSMLFYNKELFNRFAVPYPAERMTWNEAVELNRKLIRNDNGIAYQGMAMLSWDLLGSQLAIQKIDPATHEAKLDGEPYRHVLTVLRDLFTPAGANQYPNARNSFVKDRNSAMIADWFNGVITVLETEANSAAAPLDWDMVALPSFSHQPGISGKVDAHMMIVSAQSQYKEQAFAVLQHLTSSAEAQQEMAKQGKIPALRSNDVQSVFGQQLRSMQNKNIAALFSTVSAPLPKFHPLENTAISPTLQKATSSVINGTADINSALRLAQEEATANIRNQMAK